MSIILILGTGVSSGFWGWMQPRLGQHALALSYDRAGFGKSETAPGERRIAKLATILSDLQALIVAADIPEPFWFVGHSSGGLIAQNYAALHPEQIAGIVLLDPTPTESPGWLRSSLRFGARSTRWVAAIARSGLLRVFNPFARSLKALPDSDAKELARALANAQHLRATAAELAIIPELEDAVRRNPVGEDVPVLVATAGAWLTPKVRRELERPRKSNRRLSFRAGLVANHEQAAALSRFGRHIIVEGADHLSMVIDQSYADSLCDEIARFIASCETVT